MKESSGITAEHPVSASSAARTAFPGANVLHRNPAVKTRYGIRGTAGLARVDNIIQMVYYLSLFLLTVYWFGWRSHRENAYPQETYENKNISDKRNSLFGAFLESTGNILTAAFLCLVLILWIMTGDKNTYTGISALRSLVNQDAQVYYTEAMERHAVYTDDSVQAVSRNRLK